MHILGTGTSNCSRLYRKQKHELVVKRAMSPQTAQCSNGQHSGVQSRYRDGTGTDLLLPWSGSCPFSGFDVLKARDARKPSVGLNFPTATTWHKLLDSTIDSIVVRRAACRPLGQTDILRQRPDSNGSSSVFFFFFSGLHIRPTSLPSLGWRR